MSVAAVGVPELGDKHRNCGRAQADERDRPGGHTAGGSVWHDRRRCLSLWGEDLSRLVWLSESDGS